MIVRNFIKTTKRKAMFIVIIKIIISSFAKRIHKQFTVGKNNRKFFKNMKVIEKQTI